MGTLLDPMSTDFGNDIVDVAEAIVDIISDKETQTQEVILEDEQLEGYVIDYTRVLDDYDFPDTDEDLEQIATELADAIVDNINARKEAYNDMQNPSDEGYTGDDNGDEPYETPTPRVWFEDDYLYIVF